MPRPWFFVRTLPYRSRSAANLDSPTAAVATIAADVVHYSIDCLTGRRIPRNNGVVPPRRLRSPRSGYSDYDSRTEKCVPATDLSAVCLPDGALRWLAAADSQQVILDHRVEIKATWWSRELQAAGFSDSIIGSSISRQDLFRLADGALESDDAMLTLLWNTLAWGSGTKNRNNRTRVQAIAEGPTRQVGLLREAAYLSRADPESAYALLYRWPRPAIRGLGPAFFTKILYVAGAGAPDHPSLILDARVARALRSAGWESLPETAWVSSTYRRYTELIERWTDEHHLSRRDLVERWLFNTAGNITGPSAEP